MVRALVSAAGETLAFALAASAFDEDEWHATVERVPTRINDSMLFQQRRVRMVVSRVRASVENGTSGVFAEMLGACNKVWLSQLGLAK